MFIITLNLNQPDIYDRIITLYQCWQSESTAPKSLSWLSTCSIHWFLMAEINGVPDVLPLNWVSESRNLNKFYQYSLMTTWNGCGALVNPGRESSMGISVPGGSSNLKRCIMLEKNRNTSILANVSPMHTRRPVKNEKDE